MIQRAPLTQAEKDYVVARHEARGPLAEIATTLRCSVETVRKWWRQHRRGAIPQPRGRPARGILSTYPAEVRRQAIRLKQTHPHWGPANVRIELHHQLGQALAELPSDARLTALFKAACPEAVQLRHRQQYPECPPGRVGQPHQRWQIDGKEKVPVGERDVATILNVRDPVAALMIASRAMVMTTERAWRKVTLPEVQDVLRTAFTEWGCPLEVQTDHEVVYTGAPADDFPSLFTLWLIGLNIIHVTSRSRRPTDQPQVERTHRTLGDMSWKDEGFAGVEALQATLDDRRHRYNVELPVHAATCHGQPPLTVHPAARHSGRPFHPDLEWDLFDLTRVDAFLAQQVWTRQISETGTVCLGHHYYYVGRHFLHQTVAVRFQPRARTFRFELPDGTLVNELPALGLSPADLIGYMPLTEVTPVIFQLPLPLQGV